jgi:hypothetical protein
MYQRIFSALRTNINICRRDRKMTIWIQRNRLGYLLHCWRRRMFQEQSFRDMNIHRNISRVKHALHNWYKFLHNIKKEEKIQASYDNMVTQFRRKLIFRRWHQLAITTAPPIQIESSDLSRKCRLHFLGTLFSAWGALTYKSRIVMGDRVAVLQSLSARGLCRNSLALWRYSTLARAFNRKKCMRRGLFALLRLCHRRVTQRYCMKIATKKYRVVALTKSMHTMSHVTKKCRKVSLAYAALVNRMKWRCVFRSWGRWKFAYPLAVAHRQKSYLAYNHYFSHLTKRFFKLWTVFVSHVDKSKSRHRRVSYSDSSPESQDQQLLAELFGPGPVQSVGESDDTNDLVFSDTYHRLTQQSKSRAVSSVRQRYTAELYDTQFGQISSDEELSGEDALEASQIYVKGIGYLPMPKPQQHISLKRLRVRQFYIRLIKLYTH